MFSLALSSGVGIGERQSHIMTKSSRFYAIWRRDDKADIELRPALEIELTSSSCSARQRARILLMCDKGSNTPTADLSDAEVIVINLHVAVVAALGPENVQIPTLDELVNVTGLILHAAAQRDFSRRCQAALSLRG